MERKWLIIGAIIFVLFLSYLWNRNKNIQPLTSLPVEEIITQDDGTVVKKVGDLIEKISPAEIEAKKKEIDQKVSEIKSTPLVAEENQVGGGVSRSIFQDGTYFQKVEVSSLPTLEKGYFYQVWLEKSENDTISIGRLEMTGVEGKLYYSAKDDRSSYKTVIVTKEMEDGNDAMGEIVLKSKVQ